MRRAAQQVGGGYGHVVKKQLAGVLGFEAQLFQAFAH